MSLELETNLREGYILSCLRCLKSVTLHFQCIPSGVFPQVRGGLFLVGAFSVIIQLQTSRRFIEALIVTVSGPGHRSLHSCPARPFPRQQPQPRPRHSFGGLGHILGTIVHIMYLPTSEAMSEMIYRGRFIAKAWHERYLLCILHCEF